jgi:hypothetical protein
MGMKITNINNERISLNLYSKHKNKKTKIRTQNVSSSTKLSPPVVVGGLLQQSQFLLKQKKRQQQPKLFLREHFLHPDLPLCLSICSIF